MGEVHSIRDIAEHVRGLENKEKNTLLEKLIKKMSEEDRTASSCKEIISKNKFELKI